MKTSPLAPMVLVLLAPGLLTAGPRSAGDGERTAPPSVPPRVGEPAPDFTLPATTGKDISLRQFKGKKTVVLYFYPKDETPGCTREACDFRDHSAELTRAGVVVLGVSNDDMTSHLRFRGKQRLPFPLLSDVDARVSRLYGVHRRNQVRGKTHQGIQRTTFVIGKDGRIARIWPEVKVDGHVAEVLEFITGG